MKREKVEYNPIKHISCAFVALYAEIAIKDRGRKLQELGFWILDFARVWLRVGAKAEAACALSFWRLSISSAADLLYKSNLSMVCGASEIWMHNCSCS